MGGSNGELQNLTNILVEVSTKKSKITTNSTNNISTDISLSLIHI